MNRVAPAAGPFADVGAHRRTPLLRRLKTIAKLEPDEEEAIARLPMTIRDVEPRTDLIREGERPTNASRCSRDS